MERTYEEGDTIIKREDNATIIHKWCYNQI